MVTRTGFEPVNAAVKGRCVKPLHQHAMIFESFYSLANLTGHVNKNYWFLTKNRRRLDNERATKIKCDWKKLKERRSSRKDTIS